MTLVEIATKLKDWLEVHDYDEEFDDFDELCNQIMSDKQTYFQWNVDSDTFDLADAFDTVLREWKHGREINVFYIDYLIDDKLFIFIEYK